MKLYQEYKTKVLVLIEAPAVRHGSGDVQKSPPGALVQPGRSLIQRPLHLMPVVLAELSWGSKIEEVAHKTEPTIL